MPDLFDTWHVTQPPQADHHVLWWGTRVMAQGSKATLSRNPGYKHRIG